MQYSHFKIQGQHTEGTLQFSAVPTGIYHFGVTAINSNSVPVIPPHQPSSQSITHVTSLCVLCDTNILHLPTKATDLDSETDPFLNESKGKCIVGTEMLEQKSSNIFPPQNTPWHENTLTFCALLSYNFCD